MNEKKRVLIIGGTGRIGRCIAEEALNCQYDVYVFTRGNLPVTEKTNNFHFIKGDWKNDEMAKDILKNGFEIIVDTLIFSEKQLIRDLSLVNNKCCHFFYISTDSVYNRPARDVVEDDKIDLSLIKWDYGKHKRKAEIYLDSHKQDYDFKVSVIRPVITFGNTRIPCGFMAKNEQYKLVERIKAGKPVVLMRDFNSLHSICHESLFGKVVVNMFLRDEADGAYLHIANDHPIVFDEVVDSIGRCLDIHPIVAHVTPNFLKWINRGIYQDMIYDKIPEFTVNNNKAKTFYQGVEYSLNLDKVVSATIRHLESHPQLTTSSNYYDELSDLLLLLEKKQNNNIDKCVSDYVESYSLQYKKHLIKLYYSSVCKGIINIVKESIINSLKSILRKAYSLCYGR